MRLRREIALHHTVVFTLVRNPGAPDRRLHVLYLIQSDATPVPLVPLVDYVIEMGRARALSWQRNAVRAVGLFVDFLHANFTTVKQCDNPKVFAMFAEALVFGTLDSAGRDSSGLFWEPKTVSRARRLLAAVTEFSDWLENRYAAKPLNPMRQATIAEQIAYWRRLDKRRPHALLGYATYHADHERRAQRARAVNIMRKSTSAIGRETNAFPSDRIGDFLFAGFLQRGKQHSPLIHERLSLKDILITILLHGGGLRMSEPFHLFVSDVGIAPDNPNSAHIRLYHPEQGAAPIDYVDPLTGQHISGDREEYLRVRWKMQPRTLLEGRFSAGWKDLHLLDQREKYAMVHWFPSDWGELFLTFFKQYIVNCRSRHCQHPFLFVSQKAGVDGDPYTVHAFRQAHAKAARRIGLVPAKSLGTTPHAHRHAYELRLAGAGVDQLTIQRVMHHKSPEAQSVYTSPPAAAIAELLSVAQSRLNSLELDPMDKCKNDSRLNSIIQPAFS